ncbi:hypothetical protein QBC36DRAFT_315961 [Triangularia setosa]|uniref:Uncharacterized protein n=1 Tax=Triangularia setosa TaxID=2587417 RepID=A0AAN6VX09_9PEZI|nr:hypothetical protein QBC36DRAFT_315961 [Podospora setosa]
MLHEIGTSTFTLFFFSSLAPTNVASTETLSISTVSTSLATHDPLIVLETFRVDEDAAIDVFGNGLGSRFSDDTTGPTTQEKCGDARVQCDTGNVPTYNTVGESLT